MTLTGASGIIIYAAGEDIEEGNKIQKGGFTLGVEFSQSWFQVKRGERHLRRPVASVN